MYQMDEIECSGAHQLYGARRCSACFSISSSGHSWRHDWDATQYMQPPETWGRMLAKILCGYFYQLPLVPAITSLLAPLKGQSYDAPL